MTTQTISFEEWCDQVDAYFIRVYDWPNYTRETGAENWRWAYDNGTSPCDAAEDEVSYWSA